MTLAKAVYMLCYNELFVYSLFILDREAVTPRVQWAAG